MPIQTMAGVGFILLGFILLSVVRLGMPIQSVAAVGFVLLSVLIAAVKVRLRLPNLWGLLIADASVALGGILALWCAPDWAGWLTATLFVLLTALPQTLLNRAVLATHRREWSRAARLHTWAAILHPSPWMRFGAAVRRAVRANGPDGYTAALTLIEATGSPQQKALARLGLAHERRDWEGLLRLSRTRDVSFSEAKPHEIRALGELGRLDEMVQTYQQAAKWLLPQGRHECLLFVLAFTGRTDRVQQVLDSRLLVVDEDSKTYWTAVARLRRDHTDEAAHSMLRKLSETGESVGLRRSATQQLQQAGQQIGLSLALNETFVDAMRPTDSSRPSWPPSGRTIRARGRAIILLLFLLAVIWAVLQRLLG